jgi:hypothetical protein
MDLDVRHVHYVYFAMILYIKDLLVGLGHDLLLFIIWVERVSMEGEKTGRMMRRRSERMSRRMISRKRKR